MLVRRSVELQSKLKPGGRARRTPACRLPLQLEKTALSRPEVVKRPRHGPAEAIPSLVAGSSATRHRAAASSQGGRGAQLDWFRHFPGQG